MMFDRFGQPAGPRRTSALAIIGLLLAVASLFFPALGALVISAAAIVLGVLARRQLKRDPATGPSWVSLAALVIGGFVFLSQGVLLMVFSLSS
jgi:membrane-bound ClpP family serine protease